MSHTTEGAPTRAASPASLALGCIGFIASALGTPANAQAAPEGEGVELKGVTVTDTALPDENPKVERVESPKATAPLLDTPQTITVISNVTLRQQNLLTLRDALSTIPGITFGAGEGGGGFGDSINLRGFSANNDITQDGVRDTAQYSRTDPFDLQQIEVYNGSNTAFNGSGSVGGTINLVTKRPQADDLTVVEAGIGTEDYYRGAVDSNLRVGEFIAVRLNAMIHRNDYPGREVEWFKRWGVAPAISFGIESPTRLTLDYFHQRDNNTPTYGVPFYITAASDGPVPGIDPSDYFGIVNLDEQEITVDRATMTFEQDFGESLYLRNLTRWQRVHQPSRTSSPQGTICLPGNVQPNGVACPAGQTTPNTFYPSGPRGMVRDQENQLLYNQADLRLVTGEEGGTRNTLVVGASLTWEDYSIESASLPRTAAGAAVTLPPIDLLDLDTAYAGPINYTITAQSRSESTNQAVYAFDTLELGAFELNGGVRYERVRTDFRNLPLLFVPPGSIQLTPAQAAAQVQKDNLFSWRAGVVFKPTAATSLYASYANSKTPTSASVRTGCGTLISSPGGITDPCEAAPEKARNFEIGAKADLFDGGLQLTAAAFRNERTNFRVATNDPAFPTVQVLDGRSRVDGIALGATGTITEGWTLFANYTYLDSEVKQGVSDFCLNPTTTPNACPIPAGGDPQRGNVLIQTPRHSGSLFTTYLLPFGLQAGYGFTYQGSFALNQSVPANLRQFRSDDYWTHRAMLSYAFGNGLTAQLNVQNLFDELYYTNVRSNVNATTGVVTGGWALPGEARSARISLFYSF